MQCGINSLSPTEVYYNLRALFQPAMFSCTILQMKYSAVKNTSWVKVEVKEFFDVKFVQ